MFLEFCLQSSLSCFSFSSESRGSCDLPDSLRSGNHDVIEVGIGGDKRETHTPKLCVLYVLAQDDHHPCVMLSQKMCNLDLRRARG